MSAKNLDVCLTALGIERAEIARAARVHPTFVSHILAGRKKPTQAVKEAFIMLISQRVIEELTGEWGNHSGQVN